jgi:hypothetical protein
MKKEYEWGARLATTLLAVVVAGACAADGPSGPQSKIPLDAERGFITGPVAWSTTPRTVEPEMLEVCKDFEGDAGGATIQSANFTVTGTSSGGASTTSEGPFAFGLADGECREIFASEISVWSQLTVAEDAASASGHDVTVQVYTISGGVTSQGSDVSASSANVTIGPNTGALVIFTNSVQSQVTGCTLTQGYWKTHLDEWDDAADANTASFTTSSTFFASGKTFLEILQTPPKGDAYYILAHQYIAAQLNLGAGASSTSEVSTAMAGADAFFAGGSATREQLIEWAGDLAAFNEGSVGPGHCDD